jgi:arylsulfatase A
MFQIASLFAAAVMMLCGSVATAGDQPPNIVFIMCDNLGYGDLGCYGSTQHRTPNVDRLASEGLKLTSFYSASGVCTPSRAALMTGCYPRRVGLHLTDPDGLVLRPVSPNGLHPDEITIAEVLQQADYATTCIGKWHLGDQPDFLPTRQGFDSYFGIPYSDDMTRREGKIWPPLPLMKNEMVVEAPVDRDLLTKRYTEAAVRFIEQHQERPFLIYLPHAMPGSTRQPFASTAFRGKSANGAYGDSVEELDWSTGQILDALKRFGLDDNTIVVWTSDNGAPRRNPPQGSNAPLSGWGYSVNEGGMRVPCIVCWPGVVPAGSTSDAISSMMDWLPTFAAIAGVPLDSSRPIDGENIYEVLAHPARATSPHDYFLYYDRDRLLAVRSGRWKLFLPRDKIQPAVAARLYDLSDDIGESVDVAKDFPDVIQRLTQYADIAARELGNGNERGTGQRAVGRVESPVALTRDGQ